MASVVVQDVTCPPCVKDYTFWNATLDCACYVLTDFAKLSSESLLQPHYARLIDSGTSQHFRTTSSHSSPLLLSINSVDGHVFYATGKGDVCMVLTCGKDTQDEFLLYEVLYAPSMSISLVSVSCLIAAGFNVKFKQGSCHLTTPSGTHLTSVPEHNSLYQLSSAEPVSQSHCVPVCLKWPPQH